MEWIKRKSGNRLPPNIVRLITTNDARSMLISTSPLRMSSRSARYRPIDQRGLAYIDDETMTEAIANNMPWPRPTIIPAHLVPRDFDDVGTGSSLTLGQKYAQQSAENYLPVTPSEADLKRFVSELWPSRTYRLRCYVWSFWQKHLKDWWFFIRYPLAFGAALAYAIATIYHLSLSHP